MFIFKKSILFSLALAASAAMTAPLSAQSSDPAWLEDLKQQLEQDQECEVSYFINMREGQIGTNTYFEARVQCLDGRMFDANRTEPESQFTIKACGAAVC